MRPVVAALRKFDVAVAEVGDSQRHGRAHVGVATVSGQHSHVQDVLDACEYLVAGRPEVELLSVRRRVFGPEDED